MNLWYIHIHTYIPENLLSSDNDDVGGAAAGVDSDWVDNKN